MQAHGGVTGGAARIGLGQHEALALDAHFDPTLDQVEHRGRRARQEPQRLAGAQHQRVVAEDVLCVPARLGIDVGDLHCSEIRLVGRERLQRRARFDPRIAQHRITAVVALEHRRRNDTAARIGSVAATGLYDLALAVDVVGRFHIKD